MIEGRKTSWPPSKQNWDIISIIFINIICFMWSQIISFINLWSCFISNRIIRRVRILWNLDTFSSLILFETSWFLNPFWSCRGKFHSFHWICTFVFFRNIAGIKIISGPFNRSSRWWSNWEKASFSLLVKISTLLHNCSKQHMRSSGTFRTPFFFCHYLDF